MKIATMKEQFSPGYVLGHRVTPLPTIGDFAMLEVVTDPGTPGPPMHYHPGFSEFFYICDGTLDLVLEDGKRRLEAGEGATIAAGVLHSFDNPGDAPVRFVTGFSPRGFEAFFEGARVPCDEPDARARSVSPEKLGWVGANAAPLGMVIKEG